MVKRFRITWVQIIALLALAGILLGVVGTAWMTFIPPTLPPVSSEVTLP